MLRELELLPAWQLREPMKEKVAAITDVGRVETRLVGFQPDLQVQLLEGIVKTSAPITIKPQILTLMVSESGEYLFVLPNATMRMEETQLLQNIYQAMRIKVKVAELSENIADIIQTNQVKLLIAMGEATAQGLLNSTENLENLRGKLHTFLNIKLVVTYDVSHLLQNLRDKAKAWDDLCLAMQHLNSISIGPQI